MTDLEVVDEEEQTNDSLSLDSTTNV